MNTLRLSVLLCLTLSCATVAVADELKLSNGDRLTGTVVSLTGGSLTFKTAHGDLKVPWPNVTSLTMEHPLLVRTTSGPARLLAVDTSAAAGPALADIVEIRAPAPSVAWSGGLSAGLLTTGGNTEVNSLRVNGELTARTAHDRYAATTVVNRADDEGRVTAQNRTASFGYDRFITRRSFANASAILTNDRFRDLDLRTALGAGVGYQVWDRPSMALSIEGGIGHVSEHFSTAPDDSYSALREAAKLDIFFSARRVQVFHHHDGYFGVTGHDNLFFRTQNGVRLAIVAGLVSSAEIDVDYDRTPVPGRLSTDRSFALTFGYRF